MSYRGLRERLPFPVYHFIEDCRSALSWSWFFQQICCLTAVLTLGALNYLLVSRFIFQPVTVSGISMKPALTDAGTYWLNRYTYLERKPRWGDIVAAIDPQDGSLVVKRIVGLPGDSIYLYHGNIYVNGHRLHEYYLSAHVPTYALDRKTEDELIFCGPDQYFLLGDNRNYSLDSRSFGPVPRKNILGEVVP